MLQTCRLLAKPRGSGVVEGADARGSASQPTMEADLLDCLLRGIFTMVLLVRSLLFIDEMCIDWYRFLISDCLNEDEKHCLGRRKNMVGLQHSRVT